MPRGAKAFRKATAHHAEEEDEAAPPPPPPPATPAAVPKSPAKAPAPAPVAVESDDDEDEGTEGGKKETRGQMLQRHKRELKELKDKMKKMGKKAKDDGEKQEKEMEARHAAELAAHDKAAAEGAAPAPALAGLSLYGTKTEDDGADKKKSKSQVKREKRAQEDAAREARIAEERASLGETRREIEDRTLGERLLGLGLRIHEVPSDGHCLFRAVEDQLRVGGEGEGIGSYSDLRRLCVGHMRGHRADFLPFVDFDAAEDMGSEEEEEEGEEGEGEGAGAPTDEQRFEAYCTRMESKAVWGGQLEVRALALALKRPVIVYSADMPPVETGAEDAAPGTEPLRITYHRFAYSMGEHYNSARPLPKGAAPEAEVEEGAEGAEEGAEVA